MTIMAKGTSFWGPAVWRTIHSFAATYTPDKRTQVRPFLKSVQVLLPCDECRDHMKENIDNINVDDYLDDNHSLFLWTYLFHDMVNQQIGKESPAYEELKIYYFNSLDEECSGCNKRKSK